LACIGAYVVGEFRIYGASITRFHKSCRIEAIIAELFKLGVNIVPLYRREGNVSYYDGFKIQGKNHYSGNQVLSSWGDHRIFMSLFVACLKTKSPCFLEGHEDVDCSFPNFFHEFKNAGVKLEIIKNSNIDNLHYGT
jgi:3-phosphoshikimate 1-carboxyvinyltransferase